jgi:ribosomal protein S18 acetylase RimI-like enzyme
MKVTTWYLQAFTPGTVRELPPDVRVERATGITPEYARFLYAVVGGDWHWTDRLGWTREQWAAELAVPGTEFWIAYGSGVPLGYLQLQPVDGQVELRYFGLARPAIGRGLGGALLEHGIAAAWTLPERHDVPPTARVWVHTCSLDGPAALRNYQARGLAIYAEEVTEEQVAEHTPGAWNASGGPG